MSARLGIQKEPGLVSKSFWMKKNGNLVVYQIISQHVEPNNPSGPHGPMVMVPKKIQYMGFKLALKQSHKTNKNDSSREQTCGFEFQYRDQTGLKLCFKIAIHCKGRIFTYSHEKSNSWSSTYQILYDQSSHGGFPSHGGTPK